MTRSRSVNPVLLLLAAILPVSAVSKQVTENFFFDFPTVASGPCPKCSVVNKVFFGDVLLVPGDKEESTIKWFAFMQHIYLLYYLL